jgi:CRP-like cAMP-binding protein
MTRSNDSPNRLLASLAQSDFEALRPHLTDVELPQETVLFETGDTINRVYFPIDGIVSLVVDLASGETIEVGMIGRESVAGGSSALDGQLALNRAVVQVKGGASVVEAAVVRNLVEQSAAFREILLRHQHFLLAQAQQSAACNAAHSVEARLARWLLRCRDLLGSDDIALSQEFISEMLGVQRTTVSVVAHTLQQAGFLRYKRGHIRILDVEGLRDSACECYETLRAHAERKLAFKSDLE